ncbi:hypothetical protein BABINDRAFT_160416 [Babjeviella inositovora NRRL Y-12698]|uniref:Uncharacterized protein n=1 Tax=Babjeviella inositovora NRRL Y-12698 TaxID=984486 RepID=A0A1E3QTG2_9ASCO|nr:uncharacterized protein BABINDRAFT_160416 [Babjeviella inositovora NRRL Y-12698]ODQ80993.1 hypothetical protein BABINDRAFT_160416 [Babjeviella inositovora NRRL Y-12698]
MPNSSPEGYERWSPAFFVCGTRPALCEVKVAERNVREKKCARLGEILITRLTERHLVRE